MLMLQNKISLVLLRKSDKICACCKQLNAWALKHHLPDLEMNSTVITSSTVMCALLALPTITLQSVVFHFWQIMETLTEYSICTFSALYQSEKVFVELYGSISCQGFLSCKYSLIVCITSRPNQNKKCIL